MIPQQTLVTYPVFGDNASKVQPGDAKYSAGFQQADVYPAEWVNWAWNKNSAGITALNAGVASMETEIISVLTEAGKTPDAEAGNQLLQSIQKLITDAETRAKLAAHPIGSLYWSANSTDPGTLFGGTWQRIKDTFIWAAGDSDTVNATGGAKTVVLEVSNLPSHNHSVGAHKHGLNSHQHTINSGNTSSSGTTTTAGFRGVSSTTASQSASTTGDGGSFEFRIRRFGYGSGGQKIISDVSGLTLNEQNSYPSESATSGYKLAISSSSSDLKWDKITKSNHNHSYSHTHGVTASGYLYGKTDAASGDTANSSAFDSGSTGSGTAVNKMPPYTVKYCWQRVS